MFSVPNEEEAIPAGVQREQKWAEILSELYAKPISLPLRGYFKELNTASGVKGVDMGAINGTNAVLKIKK
jgi:hypothetical protein